jgi:methionyl-tRNA formyltransferase
MIQIIGHNEIVLNLSRTLKSKNIAFKIFSNKTIDDIGDEYNKVETLFELQVELHKEKSKSLIISAGAPWIFTPPFLESFEPIGIFNIHGTPLPLDRGGTIVSWLILNKKRIGNAIIHRIVIDPDAGPVLMHNEFIYPSSCHYPIDYLNEYNAQQELLVTELCIKWSMGEIDLTQLSEQPHYLSSYWPRLNATFNSWIDWNWHGEDIELFIRAFDEPYAGAQALWRGKTVWLKKAFFQQDSNYHPFQWGLVYRIRELQNNSYMAIAVNGGTLYVEKCLDDDKSNVMKIIKEGDRIYSTNEKITSSKQRTIKTNTGFGTQNQLQ